jgi:hypothetical protein
MKASSGFSHTGLHLDLRIQVMPIAALRKMAHEVAAAGLNTLMIEWEASYPFEKHAIISNQYAYTRDEIMDFIEECCGLGVEVIPLQQCFGHVEYILRHERYAHLRESRKDLCQVCPCRGAEAVAVFREIFQDLVAMHPSRYLHIGGDETYLLGQCPECQARAAEVGKSRLYTDYFQKIAAEVMRLGKRPIVWADMLLKYPEAAAEMPEGTVFMDWNYGWDVNHFGDLSKVRSDRFEFWGAPALRAHPDNHSLATWKTHFENFRDFIPFARKSDYRGLILTSWSTSGIYGYEWEMPGEAKRLFPMRRVYPLGGFRILLDAFSQAALNTLTFDPAKFVQDYAQLRFGLMAAEGKRLWQALTTNEETVTPGNVVAPALQKARRAQRLLAAMKPAKHRTEFQHLQLMADLRLQDLLVKEWERKLQSSWYTAARQAQAAEGLAQLLRETDDLNRHFRQLNRQALHPGEMEEEINYRTVKLRELHARVSRQGRQAPRQK